MHESLLPTIEKLDRYPAVVIELLGAAQDAFVSAKQTRPAAGVDKVMEELRNELRATWQRGRVMRWLQLFLAAAGSKTAIGQTLMVSAPTVTNWFSGARGLQPHNFELLRRHFGPLVPENDNPSPSEVDCAGYRYAAKECSEQTTKESVEVLSVMEFWTLWHLLRDEGWLQAMRSKNEMRIARTSSSLRRSVTHSLQLMGYEPFDGDEQAWLRHCMSTCRRWTVAWVLTVDSLDIKCWTPLHVS